MTREWRIEVASYGLVRVSEYLLDKLCGFRQLELKSPESGGVLIGKHLKTGGSIIIDELTPPQKTDKQGRTRFFRSKEHNELVTHAWRVSKGHSTYVGLWHTHPEAIPQYSSVDLNDWLNAIEKSRYEGSTLFFAIVGQTHIRIWMGNKNKLERKITLIGEYEIGKQFVESD